MVGGHLRTRTELIFVSRDLTKSPQGSGKPRRSPGLWIKTSLKLGLLQQKTLNLNVKRKSKSKSPGRENSGFLLVFDELISEGLLVGG